jgi:nitric oxide reductase activation protein
VSQKIKLLNSLLIKQIRDIKTYNQGSKLSGLFSGKIDAKNLYKYETSDNLFYNNKYEIKEMDLAFGIVLDASGSMQGDKITDGKVSMVLLHETLRALNINHSIIDHTARGNHTCIVRKYHDFKESKNYDITKSYAIMDIVAREGNNDAGALYYMEQALLKTQNKDKICIIFSDGQPTECSEQELKDQVKSMERKGIKVIGIGINLPEIAEYYTDYANGKNLNEMVKIITDILKQYVLNK